MSNYEHGIITKRKGVQVPTPTQVTNNVTVAVGVAPINMGDITAVNRPILVKNKLEADQYFGSMENVEDYSLLQVIYAHFNKFATAPLVLINVLDPNNENHVAQVVKTSTQFSLGKATIEDTDVLADTVTVTATEDLENGKDFVTSFDDNGYLVISLVDTSIVVASVTYSKLDVTKVTDDDIIGALDETGKRTGIELVDEVYPRYSIVPGQLIAPGHSKSPAVAAALTAKAELIYGLTNAIAIIDLDSSESGATKYTDIKEQKSKQAGSSRWGTAVWPMAKVDGQRIYMSAMAAALMQQNANNNDGIPSDSPDNRDLQIDGICLEDGTEVFITQDVANDYLNAYGVCTALMLPTWKFWGNNTTAYPASNDPINRWIKCVTMLNYLENNFKVNYLSQVGRNASYKLVDSIVNEYNMFLNSLTPGHLAGAEIVFDKTENPIEQILNGKLVFRTRYADYTPAEVIENTFEYDTSILEEALSGGEE